jgi:undecaprenyl-diphosphatase
VAFLPRDRGLALQSKIKAYLFNPVSVAIALIVGGSRSSPSSAGTSPGARGESRVDDMELEGALKVGLAQCLSLIPGTRGRRDHHGRDVFGMFARGGDRVLVLLAVPIMLRRRLPAGEVPRLALARTSAPSRWDFVVELVSRWSRCAR